VTFVVPRGCILAAGLLDGGRGFHSQARYRQGWTKG
jgi:hypothetical protein